MAKHFIKGSSTFICNDCGHNTRFTGDQSIDSKLCPLCWDLAGYVNMLSDEGELDERSKADVLSICSQIRKRGDKVCGDYIELENACLDASTTKTPVATRTTKYDYPTGLTAKQKKAFRAKARRQSK